VGLVTGTCLAEVGNEVLCLDVDPKKIAILKKGGIPIYEPGLQDMVQRNVAAGRLSFTTDVEAATHYGQIQFIAVGTPPDEDGSADLQYVVAAARNIGRHMTEYKLVVDKSTVPVGTADKVKAALQEELAKRGVDLAFSVASNPEFLKEGAAVDDFMKPDRIVIGTDSERATQMLRQLYAPFQRNRDRLTVMDVKSAELTKYAANAMLAHAAFPSARKASEAPSPSNTIPTFSIECIASNRLRSCSNSAYTTPPSAESAPTARTSTPNQTGSTPSQSMSTRTSP